MPIERRDDEVIQVDLGVAFPVGLPGRSGGRARWPSGQNASRQEDSSAQYSWCWSLRSWPQCQCRRDRNLCFSSEDPSATSDITVPGKLDLTYVRPTERTKVNNYAFDAFGPYPIAGAGVAAGINQWTNSPPEWGQGVEGFGKRFGSDFAIAAIGTTTRYGLAEAFREDTLYYRCECARPISTAAPCRDLHLDRAPRRRRPSRLLFLRACRALCGFHDCGLLGGIRTASAQRMRSGWATTACWVIWAATLLWSFSIADLTP